MSVFKIPFKMYVQVLNHAVYYLGYSVTITPQCYIIWFVPIIVDTIKTRQQTSVLFFKSGVQLLKSQNVYYKILNFFFFT